MITITKISSLAIMSFMLLMFGCGPSTTLTKTWTDPSVTAENFKPFNKVLVMARLKDETGNRIAEDKLVAQFKPGVATPSYSYLQSGDTVPGVVDAKLQKEGFDGIILMRLNAVDKSLSVQNSGYGGYGGYYGARYGMGMTTVSENSDYIVETTIYSLASGKMIWSGTTSTYNPSNLQQAMDEIIAADKAQLIKQGLIKQ